VCETASHSERTNEYIFSYQKHVHIQPANKKIWIKNGIDDAQDHVIYCVCVYLNKNWKIYDGGNWENREGTVEVFESSENLFN